MDHDVSRHEDDAVNSAMAAVYQQLDDHDFDDDIPIDLESGLRRLTERLHSEPGRRQPSGHGDTDLDRPDQSEVRNPPDLHRYPDGRRGLKVTHRSPAGILLPAYVVADESASMGPHQGELTAGLAALYEELRAKPMVAAQIRLAVLGFSDDTQLRQDLSDIRSVESLPQFAIRGITSYGSAFRDLLTRIPRDVDQLKRDNYAVNRPVVFFLSDGQPTDSDWQAPHRQLTDRESNRSAPNIISYGIGSARAKTMVEVATRQEFAFMAAAGADIGRAISSFFQALTVSLASSSGQAALILEKPDQFHLAVNDL